MDEGVGEWVDRWVEKQMSWWKDEWMDGLARWMNECIYVCED